MARPTNICVRTSTMLFKETWLRLGSNGQLQCAQLARSVRRQQRRQRSRAYRTPRPVHPRLVLRCVADLDVQRFGTLQRR